MDSRCITRDSAHLETVGVLVNVLRDENGIFPRDSASGNEKGGSVPVSRLFCVTKKTHDNALLTAPPTRISERIDVWSPRDEVCMQARQKNFVQAQTDKIH
jgi:hypothetical protein